MYEYFEGTLVARASQRAVVDVAGIGYILQISSSCSAKLPAPGSRVLLLAHLVVTDGEPRIFGFVDAPERELFRLLISVSGVGPATALSVLSQLEPRDLVRVLSHGDEGALRRVKGIGAKTAARLVVELRESVSRIGVDGAELPPEMSDALQALAALGFTRAEADRLVESARKQHKTASSEELIKAALAASRSRP